jgi:diguanylate cyclase (GGDEF)-like protein
MLGSVAWGAGVVEPQQNLTSVGLLDPGRSEVGWRQRWFAWSVIGSLVIGAVAVTPLAGRPMMPVPGLLAAYSGAFMVINLLLAVLLFIKGRVEERSESILLGAAYFYVSLIIVPRTLSFAGALMPAPIIGSSESSSWFWIFWHAGFAVAVIRYAESHRRAERRIGVLRAMGEVIGAAIVATLVATVLVADLPPLLGDGHYAENGIARLIQIAVLLITVVALVAVARVRSPRPEQLWLLVGLVASCVEIWLTVHSSARFALGWYLAKAGSLLTSLVVLISLMHEITRLYSEAAVSNKMLLTLARRDGLTGLSNRRHFDELLVQEFRRARRQELPLSLLMLDVDCFKGFNDTFGHPAGDDCLRRVSAAVRETLKRPGDTAARYGGEELAVLLPATDLTGAMVIGEQMRVAVASLAIAHPGSPFGHVTISVGAADMLPLLVSDKAADLLCAADQALYQAKKTGRNRVCRWSFVEEMEREVGALA